MVFGEATSEPTIFIFINEQDINNIRKGLTLFVDNRITTRESFSKVIIAHAKSDEDACAIMGTTKAKAIEPQPRGEEVRCKGCRGIIPYSSLYEDYCIVCWADQAKRLIRQSN